MRVTPCGCLCTALIVAIVCLGSGPGSADAPLRAATLIPLWLPQAQFAGYYVAQERGAYRARGVDLTILAGGPDHPASVLLERGQADFAMLWLSTAMQMRARGVPLVNIGQLIQRSALMLVAKKSSGILRAADLNDKKVAVWNGDFIVQPLAFFKQYDVRPHTVPLGSTINLFLRDGVQASVAMWYNEYHTILNAGLAPDELTTFFFSDHGLNFPEDGLYCLEQTLQQRPELVRDVVLASLDGWREAFAAPEGAVDITLRQMTAAHLGTNRVHQRWMLDRMRDLTEPSADGTPSGVLRREDYDRVGRVLRDGGWIATVPDFAVFYRPAIPAA